MKKLSEKLTTYQINSAGRAGIGRVDLKDGSLTFVRQDLDDLSPVVPIGLSHYHKTESWQTPATPKGWKNNLQQTLVKNEDDTYTYADGEGYVHTLKDCEVEEIRGDEIFELTRNVEQIKDALTEIEQNKKQNNFTLNGLREHNIRHIFGCIKLISEQEMSGNTSVVPRHVITPIDIVPLESIYGEALRLFWNRSANFNPSNIIRDEFRGYFVQMTTFTGTAVGTPNAPINIIGPKEIVEYSKLENAISTNADMAHREIIRLQSEISSYEIKFRTATESEKVKIDFMIKAISLLLEVRRIEANALSTPNNEEFFEHQSDKLKRENAHFEALLEKRQEDKEELIAKIPTKYIPNKQGDGFLAFNSYNNLILIAPSRETYLFIEYDNGVIKRTVDNLNNETKFEYNNENNSISSATDYLGRKVEYNFARGELRGVTLSDGAQVTYEYSTFAISSTQAPSSTAITRWLLSAKINDTFLNFEYANPFRVTGVTEPATSYSMQYNNSNRTITDNFGLRRDVRFDTNNRLTRDAVENGFKTEYSYTTNQVIVTQFNDKDVLVSTKTYNDEDNLLNERIDQVGNTELQRTTFEYTNKVLTKTTAKHKNKIEDIVTTFDYLPNGTPARSVDNLGNVYENIFDKQGQLVQVVEYNLSEPTNRYTIDINNSGLQPDNCNLPSDNCSNIIHGFHPHNNNLLSISQADNGVDNVNKLSYTNDKLTSLESNDTVYAFEYDNRGRRTSVNIAGEKHSATSYTDTKGIGTTRITNNLATGDSFVTTLDNLGRVTNVSHGLNGGNTQTLSSTEYSQNGNVITTTDNAGAERTLTTTTTLNQANQPTNITFKDRFETNLTYNHTGGNLIKEETTGLTEQVEVYAYGYDDKHNRLVQVDLPNGITENLNHDSLGRVKKIRQKAENLTLTKELHYLKQGNTTTDLISKATYAKDNKITDRLNYTYDSLGNIIKITENNKLINHYHYDNVNRLTREDNLGLNKTTLFNYDSNGNIINKEEYVFTLDKNPQVTSHQSSIVSYQYGVMGWKDKLLGYNNQQIGNYDPLGNPHIYRDNKLTWIRGRLLSSYQLADNSSQLTDDSNHISANSCNFTYNTKGIRTTKTIGNITTTYTTNNTRILQEIKQQTHSNIVFLGEDINLVDNEVYLSSLQTLQTITYRYGSQNIIGFNLNGVEYLYKKSIQGDVIAILDKDGNTLVKYTYDAWGNHKAFANTNASEELRVKSKELWLEIYNSQTGKVTQGYENHIANLNPFRYRSYYYDQETNLYYLNSRYYDPQTGRFINADSINELQPTQINGLNLFAYCLNNPVMMIDDSGRSPEPIFQSSVTAIIMRAIMATIAQLGNRSQWSPNFVTMGSDTRSLIADPHVSAFFGNFSRTITARDVTPSIFYGFTDTITGNSNMSREGVGINLGGLGLSGYAMLGDSFGVGLGLSVASVSVGASVGTNGIGFSIGTSLGDVTSTYSVTIGLGTVALVTAVTAGVMTAVKAPVLVAAAIKFAPVIAIVVGVGLLSRWLRR